MVDVCGSDDLKAIIFGQKHGTNQMFPREKLDSVPLLWKLCTKATREFENDAWRIDALSPGRSDERHRQTLLDLEPSSLAR